MRSQRNSYAFNHEDKKMRLVCMNSGILHHYGVVILGTLSQLVSGILLTFDIYLMEYTIGLNPLGRSLG